ncbi:hypothetical protein EHS25_008351 [Saitozyma podzolica]|uniref:Transmembrane protein n=1 Tax=Saitozyma podzolica TaxID=1890683 RepID=A0A427YPB3_9TREE|nr:hypothetical protein EHS25_008351 [Saitozyma podzolica]
MSSQAPDDTPSQPSPALAPLTPDAEGSRTPNTRASPSFDYHEERRLHLKDEIYFSHHLPRLPPPSLPQSPSMAPRQPIVDLSRSVPTLGQEVTLPSTAGGPSPSAFHPRNIDDGMSNLKLGGALMEHAEAEDGEARSQSAGLREHTPRPERASTMLSPSGPDSGDLDPLASVIHRQELDSQERLDLEEEAREREMSQASKFVVPDTAGGGAAAAPKGNQPTAPPAGEYYWSGSPPPPRRYLLSCLVFVLILFFFLFVFFFVFAFVTSRSALPTFYDRPHVTSYLPFLPGQFSEGRAFHPARIFSSFPAFLVTPKALFPPFCSAFQRL